MVEDDEAIQVEPVAPDKLLIRAKRQGVTSLTAWDEKDAPHSLDVLVTGDTRELEHWVGKLYPNAKIEIVPLANAVLLKGAVDDPAEGQAIVEVAEQLHPAVINHLKVLQPEAAGQSTSQDELRAIREEIRRLREDVARLTDALRPRR